MQLHQFAPGCGLALAHQLGDQGFRLTKGNGTQGNRQQTARVGVECGIPQLLGVHFTQAFEAADAPGSFAHAFLAQLVEDGGEFALVQRVGLAGRLLAACRCVNTEQWGPCHIHMPRLDKLGEVAEKQREQQHLDVRAVHIRIGQDADLAVAQAGHIRRVIGTVGVDADGNRDVVDFGVGKQAVAIHLPGVQDLAAQRKDGLVFLVTAHLGAAAGGVALNQKDLVVGGVAAFAIGELAGQNRYAGALALFYLLAGLLARLCGLDRQFGQFFAVVHVLVQPEFERGAHKAGDQAHGVAGVQSLLDLALELGIQHLGGQHIAGAGKHVFGH